MTETNRQNVDPFADAFGADGKGPLWQSGALINVPLLVSAEPGRANAATREAMRAEHVKGRVPPARSREEMLASLAAERARAAEFISGIDRALARNGAATPLSAQVDDDSDVVDFGVDDDDEYYDGEAA